MGDKVQSYFTYLPGLADLLRRSGSYVQLSLGKLPDTHYPYLNYPNSNPNYPNLRYLILNSDSDFDYPKLVWVIRVISPGT
jgi:hypothetical protein